MSAAASGPVALYRTGIEAGWIDYNGHLRDAYYGLIVSLAADALMDRIGIDESYRQRSHNTLYTLEMHVHFLREVKQDATVEVTVRILGSDSKRIHAAFDMRCAGDPEVVATAETMLLHVHQARTPAAAPFPPEVLQQLAAFARSGADDASAGRASDIPGSRRMELRSRS
jgi:acyl-CoA thioester hydrolase